MARRKKAAWTRTRFESRAIVCNHPHVTLRVCAQARDWTWILTVGNSGVALGSAPTREAGEAAVVAKAKELVKEIERACP